MRTAIDRITGPLFAWIPDISAKPAKRQVAIGIVVSVLLHLFALVAAALIAGVLPERQLIATPKVQPAPIELEVIPPEEPSVLPRAPEPQFIDSRGLAESKPADDPQFQSDKDMTAASEKARATGDLPLPSQDGKGRIPNTFETTKAIVGAAEQPPAIEVTPTPPSPQSRPAAREMPAQPKPAPSRQQAASTPAPAATPKPAEKNDAAALAKAALEKLREVERKHDDELAMAAKPLPPLPDAVTKVERLPIPAPVAPPQEMVKLVPPSPPAPPRTKPGFQPEQEESRVEGRITNRGKNSVDAVATPLGKYKAQVYNAVGSRWLYYVKSKMDLLALGTARVSFFVTSEGRVQGIHLDSNTANPTFADVCKDAVRDAEISRPPAGALAPMRDGRLEYTITFTLYSLHDQ
jgi:hypothetical protein